MSIDEVTKWRPFIDLTGKIWDLSFLDAHEITYTHSTAGKDDILYRFIVSYSFHCFCKDYPHQTEAEKFALMYFSPKESRPFCQERYQLAKKHLNHIIASLNTHKIVHAGYGSYAVAEIVEEDGSSRYYFVPFKAFREKKKLRLHVTSAYPIDKLPVGKKVGFFVIARNLLANKPLPHP